MNTIDLEQMFEDAQTMHLQEFISYYSSQPAGEDVTKLAKEKLKGCESNKGNLMPPLVISAMVEMYKAALQNKVPVENLDYSMSIVIWNNGRNMSQEEFTKWYTQKL